MGTNVLQKGGLQWKGRVISLTFLYPVHPHHIHVDISWTITTEDSPLHIASVKTRNEKSLSAERKYDKIMIKLMNLKPTV